MGLAAKEEHVDYTAVRQESAWALPTYIFDVDGTLAEKHPDRDICDASKAYMDLPIKPVTFIFYHIQLFATVLVVTARMEKDRKVTEDWLHSQGVYPEKVFMRANGDNRHDNEVKEEIYLKHIKPYYTNIMGVFDDRLRVIDTWLKLGLFVFNVNNGRGEF